MTTVFRGVAYSFLLLFGFSDPIARVAFANEGAEVIDGTVEPAPEPPRVSSAEDLAFERDVAALAIVPEAEETLRCRDYSDALRAGLDDAKSLDRFTPALDETGDSNPQTLREKTHPYITHVQSEREACSRFSLSTDSGAALERTDSEARRNSYACCLAGFRGGMERIQALMEVHTGAACSREYLGGLNGARSACDGSGCSMPPEIERVGCYSEGFHDAVLLCAFNVSNFVTEHAAGIDTTRRRAVAGVLANGGNSGPTGDGASSIVTTGK